MRKDRNYPGVSKFLDTRGAKKVWRWRVRVKGKGTMLPGKYGSPEFVAVWHEFVNGTQRLLGAENTTEGSINELLVWYYKSHEFRGLREGSTRKNYRATLERFRSVNGGKHISALTKPNIIALREELSPNAANNFLRAVRHLVRYAIAKGKLKEDPTHELKKIKQQKAAENKHIETEAETITAEDGFHTWAETEIEKFENRHKLGTKAYLALALLLDLAQRRSDVVTFGRQHETNGGASLRFRQQKTGERLTLPISDRLRRAIDAAPSGNLTYLVNDYGNPFTAAGFGNWFRKRCDEAGLPQCSAHGLRKAAATRLANAGATAHEIMSITGHRTLAEVERYTKRADQERLAKAVMERIGSAKEERNPGNGVAQKSDRVARSADKRLK